MKDLILEQRIDAIVRAMHQSNADKVTICHQNKIRQTDVFINKHGGLLFAKGKFIDYRIPSYLKNKNTYEVDNIVCDIKYYCELDTQVVKLVIRK